MLRQFGKSTVWQGLVSIMKLPRQLVVGLLLSISATGAFSETRHDKDVRECKKAPPVMQHPADLKKAKRDAFNRCMRLRGYATGPIRAK